MFRCDTKAGGAQPPTTAATQPIATNDLALWIRFKRSPSSMSRLSRICSCSSKHYSLRLPPMHRHIDQLADRIVHAHFGKPPVARFRVGFTFSAGSLRVLQSLFHILDLKTEVVDPFAPAARRQNRHVYVAVGEIDRPVAVVAHRAAPRFGHTKSFLVKLGRLLLIFHLDRNMPDLCHGPVLLFIVYAVYR